MAGWAGIRYPSAQINTLGTHHQTLRWLFEPAVWMKEIIRQFHNHSHQTYGARRVHAEKTIVLTIVVSHNTLAKLMQRAILNGLPRHHKRHVVHQTTTSTDLIDRSFKQTAPNRLWVTDVTSGLRPAFYTRWQIMLCNSFRYIRSPYHRVVNWLDSKRNTSN